MVFEDDYTFTGEQGKIDLPVGDFVKGKLLAKLCAAITALGVIIPHG